jgi:hypothetical protein
VVKGIFSGFRYVGGSLLVIAHVAKRFLNFAVCVVVEIMHYEMKQMTRFSYLYCEIGMTVAIVWLVGKLWKLQSSCGQVFGNM